ncbi:COX15/CtaA family protein [Candidatus Neoehrlichia procyonis]|uniref:Heme A synthase n=1 Tax=Candidatus Neoehrlichia procyonis str. RAC413 TaxID=1359163 RepID=A0A0F3NNA9_9RICK|nr:COX15/CtaA family protein [Candidatus Neoehrlichia lotoris]KJV69172.1 cytochrome oxidase assembly family protein [Candidatus Neoehrlichia lotoris str. RAC413]
MQQNHCSISIWLLLCCVMILIMIFVGGVTRLTHSGLSITEWNPIIGIIPPLNDDDWIKEKNKYETTPEYKYLNYDVTLKEFKKLYLIEYIHRLLGRVTGIIFFGPLSYFACKRMLNKQLVYSLIIITFLGILQGVVGWYMVKSGLVDVPHVSHYRLTAHLLLALIIFYLLWKNFLNTIVRKVYVISCVDMGFLKIILILIVLQIAYGALVAGLNAGLIFNTFPLMDGQIIPRGLFWMSPWWCNFFDNVVTVQFVHRSVGMTIMILIAVITMKLRSFNIVYLLCICTIIQFMLGVGVLLYNVPIFLASMHQIMAFIFYAVVVYILHCAELTKE